MKIRNRTVRREFELLEKIEAGIVLTGAEVKAVRTQGMKLEGSYVKMTGNGSEIVLINASIPRYSYAPKDDEYDPNRTRKLLLNKSEIIKLSSKMAQNRNLTIVPVSVYAKGNRIKVEIALARGLKTWQRKKVEAKRTEKRRIEKEMKDAMKS